MVFLDNIQFEVQDGFPKTEYRHYYQAPEDIQSWKSSKASLEFGGAVNAIPVRYKAWRTEFDRFESNWAKFGHGNTREEVYLQETTFLSFLFFGLACFDTFFYSAFALASHSDVLNVLFNGDAQRKSSLGSLIETLKIADENHSEFLVKLEELDGSSNRKLWASLRNRLTHRTDLPKHVTIRDVGEKRVWDIKKLLVVRLSVLIQSGLAKTGYGLKAKLRSYFWPPLTTS